MLFQRLVIVEQLGQWVVVPVGWGRLMATLAQRLEDFRQRHWMRWADPADNDLVREVVEALGGPGVTTKEPCPWHSRYIAGCTTCEIKNRGVTP